MGHWDRKLTKRHQPSTSVIKSANSAWTAGVAQDGKFTTGETRSRLKALEYSRDPRIPKHWEGNRRPKSKKILTLK